MTPEWFCYGCNKVWYGNIGECCGKVERFNLADHGRHLTGGSNAWGTVWGKWGDHPGVREVAAEHAKDGNASAACILNDWIGRLLEEIDEAGFEYNRARL